MQGDVLQRTPELNDVLRKVHPHFYEKDSNRFFIVLTQSCDLVLRDGEKCKAPYINIAPVRSLDIVLSRHVMTHASRFFNFSVPVVRASAKSKIADFMFRLLNNNEPTFFYLDGEDTALMGDMVALLNLSISIKADQHMKACLGAKILQLDDTFQAKLGWLIGQLYSRVGTEDWDSQKLKKKVGAILQDSVVSIEDHRLAEVEKKAKEEPGSVQQITDIAALQNFARQLPTKKKIAVNRISEIINEELGTREAALARRLIQKIDSDTSLTAVLSK